MKIKVLVMLVVCLLMFTGCKDATMAEFNSLGRQHKVTLYSCGQKIGEWTATGNVSNESGSDGFSFMDRDTGKLVEITGTVIITQIN